MKDIKWIFFDVGSTLIDETNAYEKRFREIAEMAGRSYENIIQEALMFYQQNKKGDLEIVRKYGLTMPIWHTEDERLYEGVPQFLEKLSRNFKIGIIANQSLGTEKRLQNHGILQYIDLVVASAEEGVAKPDLGIFEIALERSGCWPENAVMVGDRIDNDIVPAKKMGMHTIWVKQGYGKYWVIQQEGEVPEVQVDSIVSLGRNLEKYCGGLSNGGND